jgi:hypothetical protein
MLDIRDLYNSLSNLNQSKAKSKKLFVVDKEGRKARLGGLSHDIRKLEIGLIVFG